MPAFWSPEKTWPYAPWIPDHQWYVNKGIIQAELMFYEAMIAKIFTVIAGDYENCIFQNPIIG